MVRTAALLLTTLVAAVPAIAAEPVPGTPSVVAAAAATPAVDFVAPSARRAESGRSPVLPALYASLGALQAYDAYSTLTGVRGGAVEGNPLLQGVVRHPAAFVALKAGVTGASIYAAERLWRDKKRTQAFLLMVASNGVMAYVAQHNARVLRGLN
jgi:hypothetical protein